MEAGDRLPTWEVTHSRRESKDVAYELVQMAKRISSSVVFRSPGEC
jgi:hypothetical protein